MIRELFRVVTDKWWDPKEFIAGKFLGNQLADVVEKQNDRTRNASDAQTRRPCASCGYPSLQLNNGKCRRCEVGGALASDDRAEESL